MHLAIRRLDAMFDECIEGLAKSRVLLKMDIQATTSPSWKEPA